MGQDYGALAELHGVGSPRADSPFSTPPIPVTAVSLRGQFTAKSQASILNNTLGSNTCLSKVDLSGNGMEDLGAKMLSKPL